MEYEKNQDVIIKIEDMGNEGEGIGRISGYTLFVKDAIIGDKIKARIVKAKKNYGYARLMEVLEPSPYRVEAVCEFARKCGGCQIQEMSYDRQLTFKQDKVKNNLIRLGGFSEDKVNAIMEPVIGMEDPFHYRNKAQFPVGKDAEGNLITGFYAGRTHAIIPNTDCALGVVENKEILELILQFAQEFGISPYDETTGRGLLRHVLIRTGFVTGDIMVCLVINGKKLPAQEEFLKRISTIKNMKSVSLSRNEKNTNVIMGDQVTTIWGESYITDYIGGIQFRISPLSFYQVNPVQTEKLYGKALEYAGLTGTETVWDLYCGIGTISLFLARSAKAVYGVEIVPQAIEDARENARINGIENVQFFVGKAEEVLPEKYEKENIYADVIVVDPPRKGCEEICLETMVRMHPQKIVYVSCDSATLARDLKYLCERGYDLEKVCPVDQFGHTVHVECVTLLQRIDT